MGAAVLKFRALWIDNDDSIFFSNPAPVGCQKLPFCAASETVEIENQWGGGVTSICRRDVEQEVTLCSRMDQRFPGQLIVLFDKRLVIFFAVSTNIFIFLAPISFLLFLVPLSFFIFLVPSALLVFVAPLSAFVPGPPGPVDFFLAPVFVVGHAFSYS